MRSLVAGIAVVVTVCLWLGPRSGAEDRVDAVLGPYSSPITEAVADVTEKHKRLLVASGAASSAIFKKGRRFAFMVLPPAETFFEGLIDIAARRGLKTIALIHEDSLFPRASAQGALELARKQGLTTVLTEAYPRGTTDFGGMLRKVKATSPDVLIVATYDTLAMFRLLKDLDINPKMLGATADVATPEFYRTVGRDAEFVYGASQWEPELVTLRAGGLIPIARQYPGAREFVEAHQKDFPGAEISYHAAQAYGGCQVLLEAIRRAGSLHSEKVRDAILGLDFHTVYGRFKVDRQGVQIGHKMLLFQWQDGKKVIVWPEELAPGKARFPTPPWRQRP
jgi:branched-chain amino acid transport system substrate-binding protein